MEVAVLEKHLVKLLKKKGRLKQSEASANIHIYAVESSTVRAVQLAPACSRSRRKRRARCERAARHIRSQHPSAAERSRSHPATQASKKVRKRLEKHEVKADKAAVNNALAQLLLRQDGSVASAVSGAGLASRGHCIPAAALLRHYVARSLLLHAAVPLREQRLCPPASQKHGP